VKLLLITLAWPWRWTIAYVLRRPTFALSLLAGGVSMVWGAWSVWHNEHAMHSPGPVALAHEKLDCAACHTQAWQPLQRLMATDQRAVRLKMDQACIVCHAGLVHHPNEVAADVPNCVSCHREHQGRQGLTTVADTSCAACHADLRTVHGPSAKFERRISALSAHPEFALLRRGEPDPGTIAFNHAVHLKPEGVHGADGQPVLLKCATCHQPGADGRYMEPIRFDSHCASCHSSSLVFDAERFPGRPAPHGQPPDVLRGLLRERYTEYIQQHRQELGAEVHVERPLPGLSGIQEVTGEEWAWVHQRLEQADRVLFLNAGGCRYCHRVDASEKGWQIAAPTMPWRWLGFSKFSHFSHRLNPAADASGENCTACHQAARASTRTSDVLMPSIQNCRACHDQPSHATGARNDCAECHIYHNQVGGRGRLDNIFPHMGAMAMPTAGAEPLASSEAPTSHSTPWHPPG
jgi:hypothetical protein